MGYVIKLLAIAEQHEDGISLNVQPTFIPKDHPLASVSGSYNAVFVDGNAVGDVMFYGRGAGAGPTASAVVSDLMNVILHQSLGVAGNGNICGMMCP